MIQLLSNRRVLAGVVGIFAFLASTFNLSMPIDVPVLTDLLTEFGMALGALISGGLALWSYFKPKK